MVDPRASGSAESQHIPDGATAQSKQQRSYFYFFKASCRCFAVNQENERRQNLSLSGPFTALFMRRGSYNPFFSLLSP